MATAAEFTPRLAAPLPIGEPDFVRELRRRGGRHFEVHGLPSRRQEEWRFTPLDTIAGTPFELAAAESWDSLPVDLAVAGAHRLVFVNGHPAPHLSSVGELPEGVVLEGIDEASRRDPQLVEAHLGRVVAPEDAPFAALNSALQQGGAFLHVAAGVAVERPIQLIFANVAGDRPSASYPRNLIVLDQGASATVLESHWDDGGRLLSCPVSEAVISADARLELVKLHRESPAGSGVNGLWVRQHDRSRLELTALTMGAAMVRHDLNVVLDGEGAHARLHGLYLPRAAQVVDHHLTITHARPGSSSEQLFRGVLSDDARAVFNGRVVVARDAQKTDASQSNRNLLLSGRARVHSNPQLEIFADDVRCTHGSAIGRLDEQALFYLRSRGISRDEAVRVLTHAFAAEALAGVSRPELAQGLNGLLLERFPLGEALVEVA